MAEIDKPHKRRTGLLIWLTMSHFQAVGSLVIWALMARLSATAFDPGVSAEARAAVLPGVSFAPPILFYLFLWAAATIGPQGFYRIGGRWACGRLRAFVRRKSGPAGPFQEICKTSRGAGSGLRRAPF